MSQKQINKRGDHMDITIDIFNKSDIGKTVKFMGDFEYIEAILRDIDKTYLYFEILIKSHAYPNKVKSSISVCRKINKKEFVYFYEIDEIINNNKE